ncbi:MAG: DUF615 domain-containing protein [Succinivibrio sp.]|nr:DUF615 domain-containing protein [Succinivibrio sp.]
MSSTVQPFEGFDHEAEEESRSAHKREAQTIRKLVEKIADLGEQSYKALVLPEDLRTAITMARKMRPRSDERRRQLQYAAKILRSYEGLDLDNQINMIGASAKEDPNAMRLEHLREEFISRGKEAIDAFCALIQDTDRNKLRQFVKKAVEEAAGDPGNPKPHARNLYKYIKAELARAGLSVPASLF